MDLIARLLASKTCKESVKTGIELVHKTLGIDIPEKSGASTRVIASHAAEPHVRAKVHQQSRSQTAKRIEVAEAQDKETTPAEEADALSVTTEPDSNRVEPEAADSSSASNAESHLTADQPSDATRAFSPDRTRIKKDTTEHKRQPASTFLPSLAAGYISGSESDNDNADHEMAQFDGQSGVPRKNRRGQRARRQIWEQKYGQAAKHLLNSKSYQDRTQHQETQANNRRPKPSAAPQNYSKPSNTTSFPKQYIPKQHKPTILSKPETLHPSWQAKIAQKQKESGVVPFQGKKIVF